MLSLLANTSVRTPAYVFDCETIRQCAELNARTAETVGAKLVYTLKACDLSHVVTTLSPYVTGFSCSSIEEIRIASSCIESKQTIHWISPLVMPDEEAVVFESCSHVTLNSLLQLAALERRTRCHGNTGLRVNPATSLVGDIRYDPALSGSRLGVGRDALECARTTKDRIVLDGVEGLHFHANCDSLDSQDLARTARRAVEDFGDYFDDIRWVNIGGGYLPSKWEESNGFRDAVAIIQNRWSCEIYFEPGADLVRDAGYLIASVGDVVTSLGKKIAILDTTVNHWPEVFEYQFEPEVLGHTEDGNHWYILAGRSCLAGDVFGEYCFRSPLKVGDKIVFLEAGAYSLVKANRFNGLQLPNIYYMLDGCCIDHKKMKRKVAVRTGEKR